MIEKYKGDKSETLSQRLPLEVAESVKRIKEQNEDRAQVLMSIKEGINEAISAGLDYYISKIEHQLPTLSLTLRPVNVVENKYTFFCNCQQERDQEIIIRFCFGENIERSLSLITDSYSIFPRPINQYSYAKKVLAMTSTAYAYLDLQRRVFDESDTKFKAMRINLSSTISNEGLFRNLASPTLEGIIYDNLNTVFDLVSQILYFTQSEEEAWKMLDSLTKTTENSRFSLTQIVSTLPNNVLANMTHAGIAFRILEKGNNIKLSKNLLHFITLTSAGGCPFRDDPNFHKTVELFIKVMKKVEV